MHAEPGEEVRLSAAGDAVEQHRGALPPRSRLVYGLKTRVERIPVDPLHVAFGIVACVGQNRTVEGIERREHIHG
jgi:hypothetical protein